MVSGCTGQDTSNGQASTTFNAQTSIPVEDLESGKVRTTNLVIKDMYCASCAYGVQYEFERTPGVYLADVKYPEGTALAIYDSDLVTPEQIAAASTVYEASVVDDAPYGG